MSKNKNTSRAKVLHAIGIALFLGIATLLRIGYLDRFPTGIVMDEFDYVLTAKSVYHTGSNLYGNWSPWSLTPPPNEIPKGELSYLVSLPFVGPFGLSLFTARIGFALISILFVWVLYATARTLFTPTVGLVTGFIASISPWGIYFGRSAYDVPVSITMYMLSFYSIIALKGNKLLLALIPLFFAFYGYIGTKILFIPFVLITSVFAWHTMHKRRDTFWYLLLIIGSLLIFTQFIAHLYGSTASERIGQLFTPFDSKIASTVNVQRRLTLASPLYAVFINKGVIYVQMITEKFFGAFSPSLLFTNGEGIATFSLWKHGVLYPADAVFIFLGCLYLFQQSPSILMLFVLLITVGTLPSVFSNEGTTYVHRASLMYPFFILLCAYGIAKTIEHVPRAYQRFAKYGISSVYILLAINFIYLYFFRFPYYNSEAFGLSQRIYSRYTTLAAQHDIPVIHLTQLRDLYFRNYLFYANVPNAETYPIIRTKLTQSNYAWANALFTSSCPSREERTSHTTTYIFSNTSPCKEQFINEPMIVIPSLADGSSLYFVMNDRLCGQYALNTYPTGYGISDFAIENLSEKQFCERFLIRYSNPLYQPQSQDGSWMLPSQEDDLRE